MNTGPIEDRLAIRELLEKFSIGCMRKDSDIWGSTWAEDGSWKIDMLDEAAVGKGNVIAAFEKIMPNIEFVSMNSFPAELVIKGDKAHGKSYNKEMIFPKAGGEKILVGCSHDEYVKRDGCWYFLSRAYETMRRSALTTG